MKKLTLISLIAFAIIIIPILIIGFIENSKTAGVLNSNPQNQQQSAVPNIDLTIQEISKHNTYSDCWMIVNKKVYALSDFLNSHSGGSSAMIPYCGKDGTNAYDTKDKNPARSHQQGDLGILQNYYVGDLGQNISQTVIQNVASATLVRPGEEGGKAVNFGGRDREDDDD